MKKLFAVVVMVLGLAAVAQTARAQVQFGVSAGPNGLNDFYLSVGSYFNVPTQQVQVIHERDIPDEQIPVVLFIARRANVDPQEVVELREEGFSWMDVALRFGIGPDAFYVNVSNPTHTPFGHAYGYYRHYDRKKWRHIRFSDDDIVNLVNLRFVSESSHHTPDEVVRLRGQGRTFVDINEGWRPKGNSDDGDKGDNGLHRGWDNNPNRGWDKDHHGRNGDDSGRDDNGDHHGWDKGHHSNDGDHHGDGQD